MSVAAVSWVIALAAPASLALNVAVQVAVFRVAPGGGLLRSEVIGFAAGLAGLALAHAGEWLASGPAAEALAPFAANIVTYGALGYCYFHFGNLGETARRVRIVREIHEAGEGGLTMEEILRRYDAREIFDRRLARLTGTGQIVLRDGRYRIASPVLTLMARGVLFLKMLLLRTASEFEPPAPR